MSVSLDGRDEFTFLSEDVHFHFSKSDFSSENGNREKEGVRDAHLRVLA